MTTGMLLRMIVAVMQRQRRSVQVLKRVTVLIDGVSAKGEWIK